ncbi:hypothetical protein HK405_009277 [Cladochytrium tenue]|nr:hypothetical protein HK405_009277 [Cladochytrium tenue]
MFTIEQVNMTVYVYACSSDGTIISMVSNTTSVGDGTVANPGNNETLTLMTNASFEFVNFSNHDYFKVGSAYPSGSAIAIAFNDVTNETYVVGNDWTAASIQSKFSSVLEAVPYTMFVAAIESYTGKVIAISSNTSILTVDGASVLTFNNVLDEPFLVEFTSYVNKSYPSYSTTDASLYQIRNLTSDLESVTAVTYNTNVNGSNYMVFAQLGTVSWDSGPWVLVQYLNADDVVSSINTTSRKVEVIVLSTVAFAIIVGTGISFLLSRQIKIVSVQIAALRELKFQEVLDRQRGVKSRSFVRELHDLQVSFFDMTKRFADTLRAREEFGKGSSGSHGGF